MTILGIKGCERFCIGKDAPRGTDLIARKKNNAACEN